MGSPLFFCGTAQSSAKVIVTNKAERMREYASKEELMATISQTQRDLLSSSPTLMPRIKMCVSVRRRSHPYEMLVYQIGWMDLLKSWDDAERAGQTMITPSEYELFESNQRGWASSTSSQWGRYGNGYISTRWHRSRISVLKFGSGKDNRHRLNEKKLSSFCRAAFFIWLNFSLFGW